MITVDLAGLPDPSVAGPAAAGSQVGIDLFDGRSIKAAFERFDPNSSGVTWVGHIPGVPDSRVTLVYGGGLLAASIVLPDASYSIRPLPLDVQNAQPPGTRPLHVLAEIDPAGLPREAEPLEVPSSPADVDRAADAVMADTADIIDVVMVYTLAAENWAGGSSGIGNWINLGISETNSAYATSGVFQRVQLLHAERVAYTEVSSFSTNLSALRAGSGVGLGGVAALRDVYGADLVSMIVHPSLPDACGIAFLMTSVSTAFAPNGFSVVDAPCVSPNGTLAHEFGHNMGLRHDWYMDAGITPFSYAHGYVNTTARFRTIMSYPDSCVSLGFSCTRVLAFSNPEKTHLGVPMGIAGGTNASCPTGNALNMACDADERRALNDTAFAVANFRQATTDRPPIIVSHPASQSVVRGQQVVLQIAASGTGPMSYQWYRGQSPSTVSPVAGATGSSYTLVPGIDGIWSERSFYWARVSNAIGVTNSFAATLTLLPGGPSVGNSRNGQSQGTSPLARVTGGGSAGKTGVAGAAIRANAASTVVVTQASEKAGSPVLCSAKQSLLLGIAALAERSGNDELATQAFVLRIKTTCAEEQGLESPEISGRDHPLHLEAGRGHH